MIERSVAIPFLKKPPALDGSLVGDVGFDPLGISTTIIELGGDMKYVREAELMHGRQAMLATVGFVFPGAQQCHQCAAPPRGHGRQLSARTHAAAKQPSDAAACHPDTQRPSASCRWTGRRTSAPTRSQRSTR